MEHLLLILAVLIVAYAVVSALVPRTFLTAPIVFVGAGVLLSGVLSSTLEADASELVEHVAELTLVVLLFTDASRINARVLMRELGFPVRLLGIGLPLTILLGAIVAKLMFPSWPIWEAALLSAILAPTDAALGQAVVTSPKVPQRIRQALNVESGLNDGIAVPFVLLFASLAAMHVDSAAHWTRFVVMQVTLGPIAGIAVGAIGGRLIESCSRRGWVSDSFQKLSGVALAVLAWAGATAIGGNGFIAAFTAGLAIGCSTETVRSKIQEFGETEGELLSLMAFLLFGAVLVVPAFRLATPMDWGYAVLSLTLVRIVPVALSLVGTNVQWATAGFFGWFGPRGLASLIFALLVTRELELPHGEHIFTIAMLTATLSVILHGVTALPGATWYGRVMASESCQSGCEHESVTDHPLRQSKLNNDSSS